MANRSLVLFEASGIQDYVFGSNQLAQNIGASELVARATTQRLAQALDDLELQTNIRWTEQNGLVYDDLLPAVDHYDAEVVYAGGGNAMVLVPSRELAVRLVSAVTEAALRAAPALRLVAAHRHFDWDADVLAEVHEQLRGQLAARKHDRAISTPQLGLSVTAACTYTGLPAVGQDTDSSVAGEQARRRQRLPGHQPRLVSAEVAAKLRAEELGKERLHQVLAEVRDRGWEFVYDFGQLGTPGESSYIAVIHADGNRMGDRFGAIAVQYGSAAQNREYVTHVRAFSRSIRRAATKALRETVSQLMDTLERDEERRAQANQPPAYPDRRLPFRPIVFGGDDVTFVSEGALGLSLAAHYLRAFTAVPLHDEKPAFARAGVAVVKSHFPFARAYALSGELAAEAKRQIDTLKHSDAESATVLDWHFSTTGVIEDLETTRAKEYRSHTNDSLLMRPIAVDSSATSSWRTWETLVELLTKLSTDAWPRSKLKDLRDALRAGPDAVELFLTNYAFGRDATEQLPPIPSRPQMQQLGWHGNECGYFDAIEALDHYRPLEPADGSGRAP